MKFRRYYFLVCGFLEGLRKMFLCPYPLSVKWVPDFGIPLALHKLKSSEAGTGKRGVGCTAGCRFQLMLPLSLPYLLRPYSNALKIYLCCKLVRSLVSCRFLVIPLHQVKVRYLV